MVLGARSLLDSERGPRRRVEHSRPREGSSRRQLDDLLGHHRPRAAAALLQLDLRPLLLRDLAPEPSVERVHLFTGGCI